MDYRKLLTDPNPKLSSRLLRIPLRLVSLPYGLVVTLRNLLFDTGLKNAHRSRLPVISVGNLSAGGTGKSPVVAWLATWLRSRNLRVAVLSRGYGQMDEGRNDEALELELLHPDVPHLQNWDRIASAKTAEQELEMQVLVLDDGFQHRRIARDLDIVLLDVTDSAAARWLLPGGLYREPLSSLRRADVVMLTRVDQIPASVLEQQRNLVGRMAPNAVLVEACHHPKQIHVQGESPMASSVLRSKTILAFCGIGNPDAFFNTLRNEGAKIADSKIWPDHHVYTQEDVRTLAEWARQHASAEMIVCTMKDWVKLRVANLGGKQLGALRIELAINEGLKRFEQQLEKVIERLDVSISEHDFKAHNELK